MRGVVSPADITCGIIVVCLLQDGKVAGLAVHDAGRRLSKPKPALPPTL